ncbi:hypothetical protein VPH35_050416 [Triticum aestivum]|uniref:Uncharacterized protein n=1 Tax=Triticum turgidum subsp. durum TaxID=4567 RepID=A0A9R1RY77_TRITD|nr:unnamed protein product [Triticum turgidum subsp. durum]
MALSRDASRLAQRPMAVGARRCRPHLTAGDSGSANIFHNMAIMAGTDQYGLPEDALVERAILVHPQLGGKQSVDGETVDTKLWTNLICPQCQAHKGCTIRILTRWLLGRQACAR